MFCWFLCSFEKGQTQNDMSLLIIIQQNWIWFKKIIQKTVNNSIITVKLCEKKKGVTLNIKCSQISLSMSISIVNNPYWIKIITVIPKTQYFQKWHNEMSHPVVGIF